tara:strand:- start:6015 stop:6263 length:249 start_codon:yes stop_codon:yes gene_type:complete
MEKKITEQELTQLQTLNKDFNTAKSQLGDLTLQKHGLCLRVEKIKAEFQALETQLADQYGKEAVINLETGIIKEKEVLKENK